VEGGNVVVVSGNQERTLPLKSAGSFDVAISRPLGVCPGDKILIRANARQLGLINGQVLTVGKVEPDGSLHTREGISVPATFKQWTHGYVVTSHKAQGRTCDRVVVAAARLDAKSSYVACSRGRELCSLHTPDKAALMSHLPEGNRKAALDVLGTNQPKNLTADLRSTAYREITEQIRRIRAAVSRRTQQMRHMVRRHNQFRQRASDTESVTGQRPTPAESERPHYDFSPVQSQRTGIGI
jgi:ATP-dependent exoDNAse (exonuclease V) alpha subunit